MSLAIRKNLTTDAIDVREGKSRFVVPKLSLSAKSLTRFLKKPKKTAGQVTELKDLPDVRPADRHPDAPARHPIFASSDLGAPLAEKIKQFDPPEAGEESSQPVEQPVTPVATAASVDADEVQHSHPAEEPAPAADVSQQAESPAPSEDLSALSLAQLAERLETGLRRLKALEKGGQDAPQPARIETPPTAEEAALSAQTSEAPAPVAIAPLRSVESTEIDAQDNRQADMDAALKAALGTLERMTVQR